MSSTAATTTSPVKSSVQPGETSTNPTFALSVHPCDDAPTTLPTPASEPIHPPGLARDRLWPSQDDAYWRHLRDMWDASAVESRRPSIAVSPASPAFSDDDSLRDLEDVDLRSAQAHNLRLNLPELIKAQTEEANKPRPLTEEERNQTLPVPRSFAGRRAFNGVLITTTTTTQGNRHDPAPPYTRRPSIFEQSLGSGSHPVEEQEVGKPNRWFQWIPSCKWLFWIGFIFPLLWILGSITLFIGVHQSTPSVVENGHFKFPKFVNQAQIDEKYRIQKEIVWAKRCTWALAGAMCLVPVIVCLAIVWPHSIGNPAAAIVSAIPTAA